MEIISAHKAREINRKYPEGILNNLILDINKRIVTAAENGKESISLNYPIIREVKSTLESLLLEKGYKIADHSYLGNHWPFAVEISWKKI